MIKILEVYSIVLKEYLSKRFKNQKNINPIDLNKERFNVRAVFIAAIIFLNNKKEGKEINLVTATNLWLKKTFSDTNILSKIVDNANRDIEEVINKRQSVLKEVKNIHVPTLYEELLSIESTNKNGETKIFKEKNYRNSLGSYYTPSKFANSITKKTIDSFFELNFEISRLSRAKRLNTEILNVIPTITFADFSCGGGNFLVEVINYFEDLMLKHNIDANFKAEIINKIALNIFAFDVDCLAIEVAKINLLLKINQPKLYESIDGNFIHANYLLHSDLFTDELNKVKTFSSGYIYHEQLNLNTSYLREYDIILGNPPWEKIRFEEKKFYSLYASSIKSIHFKGNRLKSIKNSEIENKYLAEFSYKYKSEIEKAKNDIKNNPFFELSTYGELNTYALFTEAAIKLKSERGVVGLVLKSSIITSQINKKLFNYLTRESLVLSIFDFINKKKIFNIDSRERFCFILLGNNEKEWFKVKMNLVDISLEKDGTEILLSHNDLKLLNPSTGMLPNYSSKQEAEFLLKKSRKLPFFKDVYTDVRFGRIVHFTNHNEYISKRKSINNIPIYEGKFIHQFDGMYSGFNGVKEDLKYGNKSSSVILDESRKNKADYFPEARFFIDREKWLQLSKKHNKDYMLAWRSLTSATNTRTCISTILPFVPASQSIQFLTTKKADLLYLAGLFNSIVFDYILKIKLSGIDLTQTVIKQMPVPSKKYLNTNINFNHRKAPIKEHISTLVYSLLKNDDRLVPLFQSLNLDKKYSISDRFQSIRSLDLLFMLLYDVKCSELNQLLAAFDKQYSKKDLTWFKLQLNYYYEIMP